MPRAGRAGVAKGGTCGRVLAPPAARFFPVSQEAFFFELYFAKRLEVQGEEEAASGGCLAQYVERAEAAADGDEDAYA